MLLTTYDVLLTTYYLHYLLQVTLPLETVVVRVRVSWP